MTARELPLTRRLITQNLIHSALLAVHVQPDVTWTEVEDLATLIDVFCLFDEGHVLGRTANVLPPLSDTPLTEALDDFVIVNQLSDENFNEIGLIAKAHLQTYFSAVPTAPAAELIGYFREELFENRYLANAPDDGYFTSAEYEIDDNASYDDEYPCTTNLGRRDRMSFIERGFLYVAYSDATGTSFTPDGRRAEMINAILRPEETLAGEVAAIVREQYREHGGRGFDSVRSRVSPIAAIVFDRARHRDQLGYEMVRMREELGEFRGRLRKTEYDMYYGSFEQAQDLDQAWRDAFDELRRSYGDEPHLISVKRALNYGTSVAEVGDAPLKSKSWAQAILSLPMETVSRLIARRPLVEIHRLRHSIPAGGKLALSLGRLFGDLRDSRYMQGVG